MTELTPFEENLSNACAIVFVILIFALIIYFAIVDISNDKKRKDYINSLNEHDKSVITTYQAQSKLYPQFKRKEKKTKEKTKQ